MLVVVTLVVPLFSILYFIDLKKNFISEAELLGIKWFFICIFLDRINFLPETGWQMSLPEYIQDIGFTYHIILFIPVAFGILLWKRKQ